MRKTDLFILIVVAIGAVVALFLTTDYAWYAMKILSDSYSWAAR